MVHVGITVIKCARKSKKKKSCSWVIEYAIYVNSKTRIEIDFEPQNSFE